MYILGHGEHKTKALLGRTLEENEREVVVAQKEILGDVLVSVTGESPIPSFGKKVAKIIFLWINVKELQHIGVVRIAKTGRNDSLTLDKC